ncbi:phosphoenolpyruvate carboxykinase [Limosilactobacillus fastidiosus]|uniref:Phosphoenolpyruvate carboxykinase n=1 Tax=Limosilactobacillus fastidiosus TaxID=2759855 RepID=A0A7W3U0W1_9LACO|nr:phosphoenolpyruvate carboxykinase [Limosilactobacillus fastidiosus]MBB1086857.1 phosphoenolpyruvate carboxykinase [Limosilactobacillus fastidiosus]MCD7085591.1 phosphoenolpyruvate carboxykinase [Limosilactobacillus fastidiosus]MCD7115373.1 phosphoenolpyruvate carboxykinase [Limosilactobacillus fastidiosus]MCD7117031.1 phosphoenolpyruvate carboxykinase [Limosilactobacillus fastidiosus]
MSKDSQIIDTKSLYVNPERGVATLNYSQNYFTDIPALINSDEVKRIVKLYLDSRNPDSDDDAFDNASIDKFIDVLKKILVDDDSAFDEYDPKDILESVEELYSYYRSLLRVSVINYNDNKIVGNEFRTIDTQFNDLVRKLYRILEEKLQGFENRTYRQVNAATNATILVQQHNWQIPAGYEELRDIDFINTVMLRPPMMMHTKSNKREGVFSAVKENPVDRFHGERGKWYCYPAKIGESLAFIYFNVDYLVNGIALSNLFELASPEEIEGQKPDLVVLFGLEKTEGMVSHYYHDEKNNIWIGEVPYTDKTTYFGYMKKMCLTLHNLHQIDNGRLPIHGSMLKIKFTNGKEKNVVFFGDSGAGKSESIEALQELADDKIVSMETIFDDMGSFTLTDDGRIYAQGTETGAFVRLDDLSSAVAFNNMDRGVYLNPERKNARVIIPADTYQNVIKPHHIDMWLYANNYSDEVGIHRFDTKEEAEKVFVAGQRKALGTTDEVGMSKTFFANPFGPVQEPEKTKPIIDRVFTELFNKGVYVGEIFTHLGNDKSKDALKESASELLDVLMNN